MRKRFGFLASLAVAAALIVPPQAKAVVATIANDLNPSDRGSILIISNIKGVGIRPNTRVVLNPGEKKRLSGRNVYSFTLSRVFGDKKEKYVVACPKDPRIKDQITLRLIDIQNDTMPSGCVLERTGSDFADSGMVWDAKPKKRSSGY
ncbi:MAG: hypothetical protein U0136_19920 [Bdellovibrionota bacterium]